MNSSELLLNTKAVDFASLIHQTDIQTEADKEACREKGYDIKLTEAEFRARFDVDPSCIWYTPSISQGCIYFNAESLAAGTFPAEFYLAGLKTNFNSLYQAIQEREAEVSENRHMGSIISLPDAMQLEYFRYLVDRKPDLPDLYDLFFSIYVNSDYGFGKINPDTLNTILASKPEEAKARTKRELQGLPDTFQVYRGGNSASTPYEAAYSWTLDINVANFFACRMGYDEGYIVAAEVQKKDVIEAFLTDRGEAEIIVNPEHLKILSKTPIQGLDFIGPMLPKLVPMYHEYRNKMFDLTFAQDSSVHGHEHEARVLLLCLAFGHLLNLSARDQRVLATAAIYHDTQRTNDEVDPTHGKASRAYYRTVEKNHDPLVEFLCEYHCKPDDVGYQEIRNNRQLSKNRTRSKLLFDIFKDADALDRVRFGIKDLDLNQLRMPISKELSLVARICLEQIKVPAPTKQPTLSQRISYAETKAAAETKDVTGKECHRER